MQWSVLGRLVNKDIQTYTTTSLSIAFNRDPSCHLQRFDFDCNGARCTEPTGWNPCHATDGAREHKLTAWSGFGLTHGRQGWQPQSVGSEVTMSTDFLKSHQEHSGVTLLGLRMAQAAKSHYRVNIFLSFLTTQREHDLKGVKKKMGVQSLLSNKRKICCPS